MEILIHNDALKLEKLGFNVLLRIKKYYPTLKNSIFTLLTLLI